MDTPQDYFMQIETGEKPLPVLVHGDTHEERVALARAQASRPYGVEVDMPLSDDAAAAFRYVRTMSDEGMTVFSLSNFLSTMTVLVQEGRRLAWECLAQGVRVRDMKASHARVTPLERAEHLQLSQEPIAIPGGETYFVMTQESALRFMAEAIRDEAIYALQDAQRRVN